MKRWSAGPPGSVAVMMIGSGSHGPVAFMISTKPGISAGIAGAGCAASASIALPSK
jgi:hypothetical protein